ncbi:hypothetical protein Q3G72_009155 [Acer saccharum]|nr:hypothetical protein Q3G72_009155 [Acer saccharum]
MGRELQVQGMFKPFELVRDVYLKVENESWMRGFAFVRFGSMKEAKKVASLTHGMHMYGWPITVKVAEFGWNKRKGPVIREGGRLNRRREETRPRSHASSNYRAQRMEGRRNTFTEVVKRNIQENPTSKDEMSTKSKLILVDDTLVDSLWMRNSAVGVLDVFSNVLKVRDKLEKRVMIKEGNRTWLVFVENDTAQISEDWLENILGLNQENSPNEERIVQESEVRGQWKKKWDKRWDGVKVNKPFFKLKGGTVRNTISKEKAVASRNPKVRPPLQAYLNSKLIIGGSQEASRNRWFSSSESELEEDEGDSHSSPNRKKETYVPWILEVEIAKVVKEGAAMGYDFKARKSMKTLKEVKMAGKSDQTQTLSTSSWRLEVEIAKVIET